MCDCIIPIYNEESRITEILKIISQVKEISQIICVDDGSMDNSALIIEKNSPSVRLIRHKNNLGKTAAVLDGLKFANSAVLLLDSDLINLKSTEISRAIQSFRENKLDCLLLNTKPMNSMDVLLRHFFRFLLLAAGNRIINKNILLATLQSENPQNYQLEIAQNKFLWEHGKKMAYFNISAQDVSKIDKIGIVMGLIDELRMWYEIISYAGFIFFIKQSFLLAKQKVI